MNIALLGYGKMGKIIEETALKRGHSIGFKSSSIGIEGELSSCDVAIDFSIPDVAVEHISSCLNKYIPIVSGTTGWLENYEQITALCQEKNGAFIYASNFSLGVNIFFELNKQLGKMMARITDYSVNLEEIHHTQKLDAPSGTAITLAEGIIENSTKTQWTLGEAQSNELPIVAKRIEKVPGTHIVSYESTIDSIEIKHTAHNREGFALGAIVAAEWLQHKTGVYTMNDVLNLR
jgi:4-hydroxy-tetrahydrodipicolinate reductase